MALPRPMMQCAHLNQASMASSNVAISEGNRHLFEQHHSPSPHPITESPEGGLM